MGVGGSYPNSILIFIGNLRSKNKAKLLLTNRY
jgi:hypothetical protein